MFENITFEWYYLLPVFVSFALSAVFCPLAIPLLRKLKFGQQIRQEGNPEHYKKQGTPTMGGLAFLPAMILAAFLCGLLIPALWPCVPLVILIAAFALIGFIDDYLKVVKKQSEGFKMWQKALCQVLASVGFAVYCYFTLGTKVLFPFVGEIDMGFIYIPFVAFCILAADNAVNFTDGIDGLCGSVTAVVGTFLMIAALLLMKTSDNAASVMMVCGAVVGGLMGFLLSNSHPAKMFMGDTGSLALGAFVSGAAVMLKMEWFIMIFGIIYVIEIGSSVIQILYFKATHGKRFFKMAPIHHHFELCGYSETQIVNLFTIVTVIACILSLIGLIGV